MARATVAALFVAGLAAAAAGCESPGAAVPFPTGVYAVEVETLTSSCGESVAEVEPINFPVRVLDGGAEVEAPLAGLSFPSGVTPAPQGWGLQTFDVETGALQRLDGPIGIVTCTDDTSVEVSVEAQLRPDATADAFGIDTQYDVTSNATCRPDVPAAGCRLERRQQLALVEACPPGEDDFVTGNDGVRCSVP